MKSLLTGHLCQVAMAIFVVTKTWNHPKPPKTSQNHPKPPKSIHNIPRYTRGLHCHIISVMQYQALRHHAKSRNTVNKTFFQVALNRIGILWEVLGRFGQFCWWFWVIPCFSNYGPSLGHRDGGFCIIFTDPF